MDKDKKISREKNEEETNTLVNGNASVPKDKKENKIDPLGKDAEKETEVESEPKKKKFYAETWFIAMLAIVAGLLIFAVLVMTALGGGLSFKNLFGGSDGDLDYINDSLDK